ncbi:divalent-cation tolerance protein CutA [Sphingorhabdus arenilitoris]|uniref:Divalent-cation tolerance protein CutA n=1 Tax=Sphingorhabdus arenilitoris TaxID=1490041 RepID=A0ABV8REB0_9SPHN
MSGIALIYTVFGSAEEAENICRILLEERLVACANRFAPCISQFEWNGAIESKDEYPVLFKTAVGTRLRAEKRLNELHSYEVPAILGWEVDANYSSFGSWTITQTI